MCVRQIRWIDVKGEAVSLAERRDRERKRVRATERKFTLRMQKKLVVLYLIVLLAFVGLSIKLFYIGKNNGKEYEKQVLSQRQYDSTTLPFKRGDILDRNGTLLATSERVYNLVWRKRNICSPP